MFKDLVPVTKSEVSLRDQIARITQERDANLRMYDAAYTREQQSQRRNEQHTAAYDEVASHVAELERQLAQADLALAYRLGLVPGVGTAYIEEYTCEAAERHQARSAGEPGADGNKQTEGEKGP